MKPEQFAINLVSLAAQAPLEEVLEASAEAGFGKVEYNLPRAKAWLAEGRNARDLAALHDRLGLRCIGGFEAAVLAFADEARQEANAALLKENAELLAELGGGTMVAGTDGPAQRAADTLEVIGRRCADLIGTWPEGVNLAIEFNWSPVVKSFRSAVAVAEAAGTDRVGVLFDPAHYHCTATKFDDLTDARVRRILHVHVDDMADKPGDRSHCNDDRRLPGQGCLDLRALFGRIEAGGYTGDFSIEMFDKELWAMPPREAARRMFDSLRTLETP